MNLKYNIPEAPNYGRYAPIVWGLRESTPTPPNGTQAALADLLQSSAVAPGGGITVQP